MPKLGDGTYIDDKGYPRISAGPCRGKRVHILVAEAMLGRELHDDETCHHRDLNKLNPHWSNLKVIGRADHGFVSNRQKWFLQQKFARDDRDWLDWIENGGGRPDGVNEDSDEIMFEASATRAETSFNPEEGFSNA